MTMNQNVLSKDVLLKQRETLQKSLERIDESLLAIEEKERVSDEDRIKNNLREQGYCVPLKRGQIIENVWWVSGDEKIEYSGYGTGTDILGRPSFREGEIVVLILNEEGSKVWVHENDKNDYFDYEDENLDENEGCNIIQII